MFFYYKNYSYIYSIKTNNMKDLKINGIYRVTQEINGEVDTGEFLSDYDVEEGTEVIVIGFDDEVVSTTENPKRGNEITTFIREEFEECTSYVGAS